MILAIKRNGCFAQLVTSSIRQIKPIKKGHSNVIRMPCLMQHHIIFSLLLRPSFEWWVETASSVPFFVSEHEDDGRRRSSYDSPVRKVTACEIRIRFTDLTMPKWNSPFWTIYDPNLSFEGLDRNGNSWKNPPSPPNINCSGQCFAMSVCGATSRKKSSRSDSTRRNPLSANVNGENGDSTWCNSRTSVTRSRLN